MLNIFFSFLNSNSPSEVFFFKCLFLISVFILKNEIIMDLNCYKLKLVERLINFRFNKFNGE